MSNKLVSVVLCTYNGSRFIEEQLNSVCKQSYSNLEIIISDDKSSDTTLDIVEGYSTKDPRIKVYRNEKNLGYNLNFSQACLLANGDYIAFCDQDDIWHEDKIKRMLDNWQPGALMMYCNSIRFIGNTLPANQVPNRLYRRFEGKEGRKLSVFNTISGHALIIDKKLLPLILPFSQNVFYDWWSGVVAAYNGGVGYLPEILVFQRVHESNASVFNVFEYNPKKTSREFKEFIQRHIAQFVHAPNIPAADLHFFKKLLRLWNEGLEKKFSFPLFWFLLMHRKSIFHYKDRVIGIFSHIKHSFRLAHNKSTAISKILVIFAAQFAVHVDLFTDHLYL